MRLSKAATKKVQQKKPPENFSPKIVQNISSPYIKKASIHKFSSHHEVPVFEVSDYRALNQLIGYAKFLNTEYGDVYYRGEVHLHQTLLPSIARYPNYSRFEEALNTAIRNAISDEKFSGTAKLSGFKGKRNPALIVEALLQHYGYSTHFIDLVDNHWIALWFGLNQFKKIKNLSAVDNNAAPVERGIYVGNEIITIDLRSSLPSIFLRPHAQHGLVVRRNTHDPADSFDISANVVGIVRLRIDNVISWIGSGNLLESANLFPSPAYDYGYEILLQRKDLFENDYHRIAQYIE